jgi:hypothetical protein
MAVTFDGVNLLITLETGDTEVDAQVDLYSDWKEWVLLSDNAKYPQAFDVTGGDPTSATQSIAPYFFIRNDLGWRIKPPEEDIVISITGNLYARDSNLPYLIGTTGSFNTSIRLVVSPQAVVVTVASGSGLSTAQDDRLRELWQLQGLDSANPMNVTPANRRVPVNGSLIDLELTGDGETTTTVTRQ